MDSPRIQPLPQMHVAEVGSCDACLQSGRQRVNVALAVATTVPGAYLGLALLIGLPHPELTPPLEALLFGMAVVGAAFMLSWAAELAALDISAALAISVLALVAVLPEYAVDFVFAWRGGNAVQANGACVEGDQNPCELALANMTGANRLLIGIGWAMVVLLASIRFRRRGQPRAGLRLPRMAAVEVTYLALATVYSLTLPLKRTVTLLDMVILVGIFVAYNLRIAKAPPEEPNLVGPSAWLATLTPRWRRATYLSFFVFAAVVILLVAEHFADGLVQTGQRLGISPFFLVQWVAPLASEAPELLTAAQSLFAVAILINLEISAREAAALAGLFLIQFALAAIVPGATELIVLSVVYLLLAALLLARGGRLLLPLLRDGLRTRFDQLQQDHARGGHRAR
jgi:cation:H+ antiporter